jgi:hypothetical protein
MTEQAPRKTINVPVYWLAVVMLSVAAMVVVSAVISTALADRNARALVSRYEADKAATAATDEKERAATAEANRQFYCALFGSQLDAFETATTPTGKKSYDGWLGVYRLARCQPARD